MPLGSLVGISHRRRLTLTCPIAEIENTVRDSGSRIENEISKSGKKDAIADVRCFRIPLSTNSHGRDLLLIPPGSDGFGMPNVNSTPNLNNTANTISIQSKISTHKTFRTRLRIFYQRMIDHGSVHAFKHTTTTINKPPDPGEINDDIILLRTVAHATIDSFRGHTRLPSPVVAPKTGPR